MVLVIVDSKLGAKLCVVFFPLSSLDWTRSCDESVLSPHTYFKLVTVKKRPEHFLITTLGHHHRQRITVLNGGLDTIGPNWTWKTIYGIPQLSCRNVGAAQAIARGMLRFPDGWQSNFKPLASSLSHPECFAVLLYNTTPLCNPIHQIISGHGSCVVSIPTSFSSTNI